MDRECKTGAISTYYDNVKRCIVNFESEVEKFGKLNSNLERIRWINQLTELNALDEKFLPVQQQYPGKAESIASAGKGQGNEAFKAKKWSEALKYYSASYISIPSQNVAEKAIILANRSAALYHLQQFSESLQDMRRVSTLQYPEELKYKLLDRQARCFLALKLYPQAIACFKLFITALDDTRNLSAERRSKLNLDAMAMLRMLEQDPKIVKMLKQKSKDINLTFPFSGGCDEKQKEHRSTAIEFDENRLEGRFARSSQSIKVGEEILVEKPYAAILLQKYSQTHCQHCFQRTNVPVACPECADVIYCSTHCLEKAATTYHRYECGLLSSIWASGASINCHLAFRVFSMNNLQHFEEIAKQNPEIKDWKRPSIAEMQSYLKSDYRRIAHLVSHQDKRSSISLFQLSLMARFLLRCLDKAQYFNISENKEQSRLLVGSLLLHTLQLLQFNSHEVSELCVQQKGNKNGKEWTIFIGAALYPTLALFNHSCDPSVVRYHYGNTVHVCTIKSIEAGLPIFENYGPIYTQEERTQRQRTLSDLYQFDCTCDACLENWPTFDNLTNQVIRFRCDGSSNCQAVIEVIPDECNDFQIVCNNCKQITNIFKGLKAMQDTEKMIDIGKSYYEAGKYTDARKKFVDLLRIMEEVLAPPFPDFCQCQQYLKDCFLHLGNQYHIN